MPVKGSDVLTIPDEAKWKPVSVAWKQKFKEYNKTYMLIEFTNTRVDESEKTNFLFVSEEMIDNFKSSKIEKTEGGYKLTVDEDYLFGQQKGDKNRFLVYHDKERLIFQHRFVEGILVAFSKQATDISTKLGYGEVKMVSGIISGLVGARLQPIRDASQ